MMQYFTQYQKILENDSKTLCNSDYQVWDRFMALILRCEKESASLYLESKILQPDGRIE